MEKIGLVNFADGLVNYFILFSMLGINFLGVREIAKSRGSKQLLNNTFSNLFVLNFLTTLITLIVFFIAIFTVPKLYEHKTLLFLGVAKLMFYLFQLEWLFKGLEDFKYITIRALFIKLAFVVSVFLFVKSEQDYWIYYLLFVLVIVFSAILNIGYSLRFVKFQIAQLNLRNYLKPFLVLGSRTVLTSMYTTFNIVYLAFASSITEVGYYTTATKLFEVFLALYGAFTLVMLPRMSALVAENRMVEFKRLTNISFDLLFGFAFPTIIIAAVFAPQIILLVCGPGYEGAITPMRLIMPLVLIIGYEQIIIIQVLLPLKKDNAIFINSLLGAVTGILLNLILVKTYKSSGSAMVWIISEIVVLISGQYFVYKYLKYNFPYKRLFKYIIYSIPAFMLSLFVYKYLTINGLLGVLIASIFVFSYFGIVLIYGVKSELALEYKHRIVNNYRKRSNRNQIKE